jgi:hypothetical protein
MERTGQIMAYLEDILPQIRKGRKLAGADFDDKWMTMSDVLRDDWELEPESKKHKSVLYLWSDGAVTLTRIRVSLTDVELVETREIEWEVTE